MTPKAATCPSDETLADYGLGKLDQAGIDTIHQHLETCADCRALVAALPGDSFVDRLREAGAQPPLGQAPAARARTFAGDESLPDTGKSFETPSMPSGKPERGETQSGRPSSKTAQIPPELTNHPDYEIIKELGQGGMGIVYLARNRIMDRLEVLKVVSRSLLEKPGALERFQQEIRSAAKLAHPNIVAAYSVLRPGDLLVFCMEYVDGQDLSQVVKQRGALPVTNATFYAQQVALGLQHAHEKGMVHRDIKPNNLMLAIVNKKHIVKILDFGLAKATSEKGSDAGLTKSGQMLGTPDYIAPEQTLDAQKADIRADIYSLGCTLYYLLAGQPPFNGNSLYEILRAHHQTEAQPLNLVRPEVPAELAAVVSKMMAKEPAQRYQTPSEVAKALGPFFKSGSQSAAAKSQSSLPPSASIMPPPVGSIAPQPTPIPVAPQPIAVTPQPIAVAQPISVAPPLPVASFPPTTLVGIDASTLSSSTRSRKKSRGQRNWLGFSIAAGLLFAGLVSAGVFWFKFRTTDGLVTVQVNVPNPEVLVDGNRMTVTWDNGGKQAEIHVPPGSRKIELKKDGFQAFGQTVSIERGSQELITATLEPLAKPVAEATLATQPSENPAVAGPAMTSSDNPAVASSTNTAPPAESAVPVDSRTVWKYTDPESGKSLTYTKVTESRWIEVNLQNVRNNFELVQANAEYVELIDRSRDISIRLFDDHCDLRRTAKVTYEFWRSGNWISAPAATTAVATNVPPPQPAPATAPPLAIAPFDAAQAEAHQKAWAKYLGVRVEHTNSIGMRLTLIPPGEFMMGSPKTEPNRNKDEDPQHRVRITRPLYLGTCEVTQAEYQQVMGKNPSWYSPIGAGKENVHITDTGSYPVEQVTWHEAAQFCQELSQREGVLYRLPTEAEWEYACRAGTTTAWFCGDDETQLKDFGRIGLLATTTSHATRVGNKKPNAFGLYDTLGNVDEWCQDWDGPAYYSKSPVDDPRGPSAGESRVIRGGFANNKTAGGRSAARARHYPDYRAKHSGFRVVCASTIPRPGNSLSALTPTGVPIVPPPVASSTTAAPSNYAWPAGTPAPAIAPFDAKQARAHQDAWAKHLGVPVEQTNSIGIKLTLIPPGEFMMGSSTKQIDEVREMTSKTYPNANEFQLDQGNREAPKHRVVLTRACLVGSTEVTIEQFAAFVNDAQYTTDAERMGGGTKKSQMDPALNWRSPGYDAGDEFPVTQVTWGDAARFCNWLSRRDNLRPCYVDETFAGNVLDPAGTGYRLPTEAEWEFSCRGGTSTHFWFGDNVDVASDYAWISPVSGNVPHPVGLKPANPFGLYDITGNVGERCHDWYSARYPDDTLAIDPTGTATGTEHPIRGGQATYYGFLCRSAFRSGAPLTTRAENAGFRVMRVSTNLATPAALNTPSPSPPALGTRGVQTPGRGATRTPPPAVTPFDAMKARALQQAWSKYLDLPVEQTNSIGMKLVLIPPGEFPMGTPATDTRRQKDEDPQHRVVISRPFYLGTFEVTQAEYQQIVGTNPSFMSSTSKDEEFKALAAGKDTRSFPVDGVSWKDAQNFCKRLSRQENAEYRLPTEAEWEYACRAGTTTSFASGNSSDLMSQYGWFEILGGASRLHPGPAGGTHPVGLKPCSPFGNYDMHGNASEWCEDWYDSGYYANSPLGDPQGPASGSQRSHRGGDWTYSAGFCRTANRFHSAPDDRKSNIGFRVVQVIEVKPPSTKPPSTKKPSTATSATDKPAVPPTPNQPAEPTVDAGDPIAAKLADARTKYDEQMATFREGMEKYFSDREDSASNQKSSKPLDQLKDDRAEFLEHGVLPKTVPASLRNQARDAVQAMADALHNAFDAYQKANQASDAIGIAKSLDRFWAKNAAFLGPASTGAYSSRSPEMRELLAYARGGDQASEAAVNAALDWLARHQSPAGNWSIDHFNNQCQGGKICSGGGSTKSDTAATAMAVLPMLAAGHTHKSKGPYQKSITGGLMFLVKNQKPDGSLVSGSGTSYSHALAAICLCEAYGMTKDRQLGAAAQGAVRYIENAQCIEDGGWRYSPGQPGDTSVTSWQLAALKNAQAAGLQVDAKVLDQVHKFLRLASSKSTSGGAFGYLPDGAPSTPMTAAGLLSAQFLGLGRDEPAMVEGIQQMTKSLPRDTSRNSYYWYYGTQFLHNLQGPAWDDWNTKMRQILVDSQVKEGCSAGSWAPDAPVKDAWGDAGGRLMMTSFSALTLEVYYRYPPLYTQSASAENPTATLQPAPAVNADRVEMASVKVPEAPELSNPAQTKPDGLATGATPANSLTTQALMSPDRPALQFNGRNTQIIGPHIPLDDFQSFTIEAWVKHWKGVVLNQGDGGDPENSFWISRYDNANFAWESGKGENSRWSLRIPPAPDWEHLALVYTSGQASVYVNGKAYISNVAAPQPGPLKRSRHLTFGGRSDEDRGSGQLAAVRISNSARYQREFIPQPEWAPDSSTVLLYDARSIRGNQIIDLSNSARHGNLTGFW